MAEILVLVEHQGETVKKVTFEMLTAARAFGEPSAVWAGGGVRVARRHIRIAPWLESSTGTADERRAPLAPNFSAARVTQTGEHGTDPSTALWIVN